MDGGSVAGLGRRGGEAGIETVSLAAFARAARLKNAVVMLSEMRIVYVGCGVCSLVGELTWFQFRKWIILQVDGPSSNLGG